MPHRYKHLTTALVVCVLGAYTAACPDGSDGVDCKSGLLATDLVVTEIMANPFGKDEGGEWFEIYNPGSATVSLNGLRLEAARADGTGDESHTMSAIDISPGQYLVLGGMIPEVQPAYVDYVYTSDLASLRNAGGQISLYCGDALVDRAISAEMSDGVSHVFDGTLTPNSIANDNLDSWCESQVLFEPDAYGTPGTANEACESELPSTECREGDAVRAVVAPPPGGVVITEIMPDPSAAVADDTNGEWFEVYVAQAMDLNGLRFGTDLEDLDEQVASPQCVPVAAGTYLIFAHEEDQALNGGLPRVDWTFDFSLSNERPGEPYTLFLAYGDQLLDGISWESSGTGVSSSLEPTLTDPGQNDNPAYWCEGTDVYGGVDGDRGSPGEANPSCGISPEGQCYDQGVLRDIAAPGAGDLVITEFMPNPAAVLDVPGEWFELLVNRDVDLNGLQVGKVAPDVEFSLPGGDCLPVTAGTRVIFAKDLNAGTNGNLPRADYLLDMSLTNSNSSIFVGLDDVVIDAITYSSSHNGASTSLDPNMEDAAQNDDEGLWCEAVDAYGDGDLGTPGGANPSCGLVPAGQCYGAGGVLRDKVPPVAGDLVITEVMPNPAAVGDGEGEWFEVYVTADADLNGLQLGNDPLNPDFTLPEGDCLPVTADTYLIFALNGDLAENGGLSPVDFVNDHGLTNEGTLLFVGLADVVFDQVSWSAATPGASLSLSSDARDTVANDDPANWCDAVSAYGDGDLGTPRAANPLCP
jgi:hypothetical protein